MVLPVVLVGSDEVVAEDFAGVVVGDGDDGFVGEDEDGFSGVFASDAEVCGRPKDCDGSVRDS